MSIGWIVTAAVLVVGTVVTLARISEVLVDAATVLDDEHGVGDAVAPLTAMRDDAELAAARLRDVGTLAGHPLRLARGATRRHPWAEFGRRLRAPRPRAGGDAP